MNKAIKKVWAIFGIETKVNGLGEIEYERKNPYTTYNNECLLECLYLIGICILNCVMKAIAINTPNVFTILGFVMTLIATIALAPFVFNVIEGYYIAHKRLF